MNEDFLDLIELPPARELPPENADLREYIRFADRFNPAIHARQRFDDPEWAQAYRQYVSGIWQRFTQQYKDGEPIDADPRELLLCLSYDVAVGPYLGVPESSRTAFYQQLIRAVATQLDS